MMKSKLVIVGWILIPGDDLTNTIPCVVATTDFE